MRLNSGAQIRHILKPALRDATPALDYFFFIPLLTMTATCSRVGMARG